MVDRYEPRLIRQTYTRITSYKRKKATKKKKKKKKEKKKNAGPERKKKRKKENAGYRGNGYPNRGGEEEVGVYLLKKGTSWPDIEICFRETLFFRSTRFRS